jgi:hypothetical protein
MTEAERIARAHRAQSALDEFLAPILDDMDAEYTRRMVEVANTELSRDKRADKLTALSNALRISSNIRSAMQAIVMDGEVAHKDKLRAEKIEQMTAPQRRLLTLAPLR